MCVGFGVQPHHLLPTACLCVPLPLQVAVVRRGRRRHPPVPVPGQLPEPHLQPTGRHAGVCVAPGGHQLRHAWRHSAPVPHGLARTGQGLPLPHCACVVRHLHCTSLHPRCVRVHPSLPLCVAMLDAACPAAPSRAHAACRLPAQPKGSEPEVVVDVMQQPSGPADFPGLYTAAIPDDGFVGRCTEHLTHPSPPQLTAKPRGAAPRPSAHERCLPSSAARGQ